MKDYEKMWNELKEYMQSELEYRKSGIMQSTAESIHGEAECNDIIDEMKRIEERNSN